MTATILTRLKELARDMVGEPLDADQHVDLRAGELRDIIQAVEAMGERPTVVNYVERIQYHAERADTAEADLASLRAEMDEAVRLMKRCLPHVKATNGAEHLLDGFGPRSEQRSDGLLAEVEAFISRKEGADV